MAQARLFFRNGCVADISSSRVHPEPRRCMQVFGAEGYAGIDFGKKKLTLMQPGETLRSGRVDSRRLDPALAASLRTELFSRFVETVDLDCSQHHRADQLTRELEEFVHCVETRAQPRVDGQAGAAALEVAQRVVDSLRRHRWDSQAEGAAGPNRLPALQGRLFAPRSAEAA
jgi:predicted dehydrogenase